MLKSCKHHTHPLVRANPSIGSIIVFFLHPILNFIYFHSFWKRNLCRCSECAMFFFVSSFFRLLYLYLNLQHTDCLQSCFFYYFLCVWLSIFRNKILFNLLRLELTLIPIEMLAFFAVAAQCYCLFLVSYILYIGCVLFLSALVNTKALYFSLLVDCITWFSPWFIHHSIAW